MNTTPRKHLEAAHEGGGGIGGETWRTSMSLGLLISKIEYWTHKYEFSFQFWGENNNNVYINRGSVEIGCLGGRHSIRKLLEETIAWCEKANPRFKYPVGIVGKEIDLPD